MAGASSESGLMIPDEKFCNYGSVLVSLADILFDLFFKVTVLCAALVYLGSMS